MPTIKYRLSSRVNSGNAEVLARFYDGEFSQRAKTRISVPVDCWDCNFCKLSIPRKVTPESVELREKQHMLDSLTDAVYSAWWRDRFDVSDGWLQRVIDDFHHIENADKSSNVRIRMSDLTLMCAESKNILASSFRNYRILANILVDYERSVCRELYADNFCSEDVDDFYNYLSNGVVVRSRNTIYYKLTMLSSVCRFGVAKGYMCVNPFGDGGFKIKSGVYGDPVYLTIVERNYLYNFKGLPKCLEVQRDIFIFQCHIGCRVSDLIELKHSNITSDGFLQYIQHKLRTSNQTVVRVPLSKVALEIIERYKDCSGERLLPFVNVTLYNKRIKEFFRLAGMNRVVMVQDSTNFKTNTRQLWQVASSHLARRTFMANMFKATKSERITSSFTGHSNGSRSFSRYTSVDDDMKLDILKAMKEIDEF